MSGGGKGGSQKTKVEIPKFIEDGGRRNIDAAQRIAQTGYVPYYGPSVAAATPQMQASWQGANDAAGAFGMAQAAPQMPQAQDFGGGLMGYGTGNGYEAALAELQRRRPEQFRQMQGIFGSPQAAAPQPAPQAPAAPQEMSAWDRMRLMGGDR